MCSFLLVSCGPKKEEKMPSVPEQVEQMNEQQTPATVPANPSVPAQKNGEGLTREQKEKPDTSLMYPEHLGEKAKKDLTPEQQDELEINEDNVMNPFPG